MTGTLTNDGDATPSENTSVPNKLPVDGAEWVDLFVREMISATGVEDARARASRVLEILERSISKNAAENAAQSLQKVSICSILLGLSFSRHNDLLDAPLLGC